MEEETDDGGDESEQLTCRLRGGGRAFDEEESREVEAEQRLSPSFIPTTSTWTHPGSQSRRLGQHLVKQAELMRRRDVMNTEHQQIGLINQNH